MANAIVLKSKFKIYQVICFLFFFPLSFVIWLFWDLPKFFFEFISDEWKSAYRVVYDIYITPECRKIQAKIVLKDYEELSFDEFCQKYKEYKINEHNIKEVIKNAKEILRIKSVCAN